MSEPDYKSPMLAGMFYLLGFLSIVGAAALLWAGQNVLAATALIGGLLYLGLGQTIESVARTQWRVEQIGEMVEELDTERIMRQRDQRAAKSGK